MLSGPILQLKASRKCVMQLLSLLAMSVLADAASAQQGEPASINIHGEARRVVSFKGQTSAIDESKAEDKTGDSIAASEVGFTLLPMLDLPESEPEVPSYRLIHEMEPPPELAEAPEKSDSQPDVRSLPTPYRELIEKSQVISLEPPGADLSELDFPSEEVTRIAQVQESLAAPQPEALGTVVEELEPQERADASSVGTLPSLGIPSRSNASSREVEEFRYRSNPAAQTPTRAEPGGLDFAKLGISEGIESRYAPTWLTELRFPVLRYARQSELSLVEAIHTAIQFAPEIEILRTQVGVNRAEVIRQQANFDWNSFVEANWDEFNVPVGSDLDGAISRSERHTLQGTYGVERLNKFGGQLRLAQDMGFADSNSSFFNPPNQANARWALEYQQPLLQGAGLLVNTSIINIAVADAQVSEAELVAGLQEHVLEVVTAYWALVQRRGEYVIQKRSYDRALRTATIIANRTNLDVSPVQSARSEATLNLRRTAVIQAEYEVVFAQERLLRLIFGAQFKESVDREVIPISDLFGPTREVDMAAELQVAFQNRPEIRRSLQLIKRASLQQGVAQNQLLPLLGLSLSMSNQGLKGNRGLGSALNDQWDLGDPTYGVGLTYALPIGNRAAKANLRQAQLQARRFQKEFETVVAEVALEVRNASHSISLNGKQRAATEAALVSASRELDVLSKRIELLIDGIQVGPLYLDNLLQTQDRLASAETGYLAASSEYALAHFELQRATGGLLRSTPLPVEAAASKTWTHRHANGLSVEDHRIVDPTGYNTGYLLPEPKFNAGR